MCCDFKVRFAAASDLELISQHRARMFADMGKLPAEMGEAFRTQSHQALRRMFDNGKYFGWLASLDDQPEKIVAGAGVQLREVPPHPQPRADGKIDIVAGQQAIIQNVY